MAHQASARETFVALRHQIAKIEGRLAERLEPAGHPVDSPVMLRRHGVPAQGLLETGSVALDKALGGGIPRAGLIEIHGESMRDGGAVAGFALGLIALMMTADSCAPLLWIATQDVLRESGRPYAPGLMQRFGIPAARLLMAGSARPVETLWIAEEAANAAVFCAVMLETRGSSRALDLTATRRLHRRALMAGMPMFLMRQSGASQPTAATVRLRVAAAGAGLRRTLAGPFNGSIGPPAVTVAVEKSPTAMPASATLEWTYAAFQERVDDPPALSRAVVPLPAGGAHDATSSWQVLAFLPAGNSTNGVQPPREQHPAGGVTRRSG